MMIFQNYYLSLGAAETSLLNLASAYASFANGGKKLISKFDLLEFKTGEEKTIFKLENKQCVGCDKF